MSAYEVRQCVNFHLRNNYSEKRKVRSDAGRTIFNSPDMRKKTYNNYFKKLQRKNNAGMIILDKVMGRMVVLQWT